MLFYFAKRLIILKLDPLMKMYGYCGLQRYSEEALTVSSREDVWLLWTAEVQ